MNHRYGDHEAATLTPAQVAAFRRDGYLVPLPALSPDEATAMRERLEALERSTRTGRLPAHWLHKTHLVVTAVADLVRHDAVLDAVEAILGPDLLCWNTDLFVKEARSPSFVSWHQDSTYWGLDPPDVVTAWVALTRSQADNGAVRVVPGSCELDQLEHVDTAADHNLLSRGQEVAVEVDESTAVTLELQPGEMSLHHIRLVHGSAPNTSDDRRIGVAIRYLAPHVRQRAGRDSATLVRGHDAHGNFELEPRPARDLDPAAVDHHRRVLARTSEIVGAATPGRPR